jgi:uncharacterized protein YkwD
LARRYANLRRLAVLLLVGLTAGCNTAVPERSADGAGQSPPGSEGAVLGTSAGSPAAKCLDGPDVDELARQVLTLINIERAQVGVSPLTWNGTLAEIAEDYACTMAAEDFFDHVHPVTGDGPAERAVSAGYEFFAIGENLAAGQTSAAEAVEGWMNSPGHRDNLLSPEWRETGLGVRRGGSLRIYWVQQFGKPASYTRPFAAVPARLVSP